MQKEQRQQQNFERARSFAVIIKLNIKININYNISTHGDTIFYWDSMWFLTCRHSEMVYFLFRAKYLAILCQFIDNKFWLLY